MLFNKDIVAYSCKVCLKYILNPEQRVSVTNIINQRIVEVTNFKKLNEYQKFICCQCDKKLIECVKFRTEAIANIE
ncbi:hypothetical protein PVAND_006825 [Polypedilum vanderplanki]|uniref:Uncharacterized protein n=1 Tax=Polypedilum vanderplanki TaxID=319348 RepID=A0A9J6C5B5_POLVA|nr:hypothetical protein PVAND_006825 [Polypedilum vanderplanki]